MKTDTKLRMLVALFLVGTSVAIHAEENMLIVGDKSEQLMIPTPRGAVTVRSLDFERQPAWPGEFGPRDVASSCGQEPLSPGRFDVMEPTQGVTSDTGLLLTIGGLSSVCTTANVAFPFEQQIADRYNLMIVNVLVRNLERQPVDYARYKVGDALRGLGTALQEYPQIDRQRIHLYGRSGGGLVAHQMYHLVPGWASVTALTGIKLLSTRADVDNLYEQDPGGGWGEVNGWAGTQQEKQLQRYFQSPLSNLTSITVDGSSYNPYLSETRLTVGHGTIDDLVDFQHFIDMRLASAERLGLEDYSSIPENNSYYEIWSNSNQWWFALNGDDHYFSNIDGLNYLANFQDHHAFDSRHPTGIQDTFFAEIKHPDAVLQFYTTEPGLENTLVSPLINLPNIDRMVVY